MLYTHSKRARNCVVPLHVDVAILLRPIRIQLSYSDVMPWTQARKRNELNMVHTRLTRNHAAAAARGGTHSDLSHS